MATTVSGIILDAGVTTEILVTGPHASGSMRRISPVCSTLRSPKVDLLLSNWMRLILHEKDVASVTL